MDPINDVNPLCPCWIIMKDGSQHHCDMPVGFSGGLADPTYTFMTVATERAVAWREIAAFESIANPAQRIVVR
ncbi:MAG: hypothetical protein JWO38_8276 [Gemmataceae bacterium]|nr:hypothetical protein [Gemmataceae bacterium]